MIGSHYWFSYFNSFNILSILDVEWPISLEKVNHKVVLAMHQIIIHATSTIIDVKSPYPLLSKPYNLVMIGSQ